MKQLLILMIFSFISTVLQAGSFVDNGDETVTDLETNLMWKKTDQGTEMNWLTALSSCEDLDFAGHTDWRVPNIKELKSILDHSSSINPQINSIFTTTASDYTHYWSSTSNKLNYSTAWDIDIFPTYNALGYEEDVRNDCGKSSVSIHYVLCVRGSNAE